MAKEFKPMPLQSLTKKYDGYFRKYSKRFFGPGLNWKWFKAQAFAESNLKNEAKSWVNAKGIMQIMPKTFEEIRKKKPGFKKVTQPRWNIAAGIYYDNTLYRKWKVERPFNDRINFMLGSYNAGFATIVRAQGVCKEAGLNENLWENIESIAPTVKGWREKETLGYVNKINRLVEFWGN